MEGRCRREGATGRGGERGARIKKVSKYKNKIACAFRDSYEKFKKVGAEVVGISGDDSSSHKAFAKKYKLPFTLLSNEGNKNFALLISWTYFFQHSIGISEAKKVVPPLLEALTIPSLDIVDKNMTYNLLLVLSGILMDENGKEAIVENAHIIIGHLIKLVTYPHMMLVRETTIQCLTAMSALPHTKIYPLRPQVLKALSLSLDDWKKVVRQEAVRCRQAWASIASRSLHF